MLFSPRVNDIFFPTLSKLGLVAVLILSDKVLAQSKESAMAQHLAYRTVKVDGSVATTRGGLARHVRPGVGVNRRPPVGKPVESVAADFPVGAIMTFLSDRTFSI
jgi:hypothetical protein